MTVSWKENGDHARALAACGFMKGRNNVVSGGADVDANNLVVHMMRNGRR